jgi:hypothetical protein
MIFDRRLNVMDKAGNKLTNKAFEKKLKRIERWLKRCMVACKCGSWNSAMMEMECMEAETREFREELWIAASCESAGISRRPVKKAVLEYARVLSLSAVFLLATGLPLSVDQDRPLYGFQTESFALLTSTESEILDALRESLSSRNSGTVVFSVELPEEAPIPTGAAAASVIEAPIPRARARVLRIGDTLPEMTQQPESEGEKELIKRDENPSSEPAVPSVEDVLSLIQVGQRALRVSEPAVRVIPVLP